MPVAIAGMHRSGTSMIARLLNLCGLYLGDEKYLIPAAEDNQEGFWEHTKFQGINEEILTLFNGGWDILPTFEKNWEESPSLTRIYEDSNRVIGEISRSSAWGWKDPRNSLTLPFWKKQLPDLKVVICLRNPFDVYRSLARRGYASSTFSYHLWLEYNQRVMNATKPEERIITHYNSFFYDPQAELQRLFNFLEMEVSDETINLACKTISNKLRHNASDIHDFYATNPENQVIQLYQQLCLNAGLVYGRSILPKEAEFLEQMHPTDEITENEKTHRYVRIINAENLNLKSKIARLQEETTRLQEEIARLQEDKTDVIARLQEDKADVIARLQEDRAVEIVKLQEDRAVEIAKLQEDKITEIAKLQEDKLNEIAKLQEEKTSEIIRIQEERIILQSTINEIFASRSWRLIRVAQNIRLFFVPRNSQREKILKVIYRLVTFKYVRDILSIMRMREMREEQTANVIEQQKSTSETDLVSARIYSDLVTTAKGKQKDEYVAMNNEDFSSAESLVKLIAFYLPQFHPIPENDEWWGKGFVEWTNVSKAVPQFVGHYQPHLPGELGFYDLRIPDILKRQIELARKYGIHGFAFHYYWFNGKRLLEKPLDLFLNSDEDFPFCVCWANENWTRRWDGQENELLIAQNHSPESDLRFIQDVSPILKDARYIRVNGRPLLIVYRANIIPDIKKTVKLWREYCINNGIGDPYLVAAQTFWFEDPRIVGFDAAVEFPPHNVSMTNIRNAVQVCNPNYEGNVYAYSEIIEKKTSLPKTEYKVFKTIFPGWDNEARKPEKGNSFAFSSPARYKEWLVRTAKITLQDPDPEKRYVFINAWNEWGEGAHLEPDRKYGYAYLQATVDALKEIETSQPEK